MVYVSFLFTFLLSSQVFLAQQIQKEERIGTHKARVHHQLIDSTSSASIDYHQPKWTIPAKRDYITNSITYVVSDYYPSIIILPMLLNIPKNPLIPPRVSNPWVTPIPPSQNTPWILPIPPSQNTPWTTPTPPIPTND
ncbi:hypothetical protein PIB30_050437 [Stylosanthes scabra]|uniref:Uncharacterized protein n=1 Tax=Stylosanthes scabra TaxID=79078 RepID=A0ABU6QH74_9FABA|nr:hypothetical protein [Stylosanthes scabra]